MDREGSAIRAVDELTRQRRHQDDLDLARYRGRAWVLPTRALSPSAVLSTTALFLASK
jgi:hypothetical protein